jgi:selenocysteine-specific elongation factor
MMIATAGHVDHGKTKLVRLLTGCNTDRLKEERERGLTIELGFAPCWIGGNLCVGIVDVPGHEKFVRTMVAGVSGIDLAVLVIAADDGVMPQTVEHLDILSLLGVRRGIVALTKIDLVEPSLLEERLAQVRDFLRGTILETAPVCPVSSETFQGFEVFYEHLVREVTAHVAERGTGIFRMPVAQFFSRPGFGTVVTGLPVDGSIRAGDQVELTPGKLTGRIRGIQRFLRDASEGWRGQCLALNIPDLPRAQLARGQVVSLPGYLRPVRQVHLKLSAAGRHARPLQNGEQIKFHAGTSEASGKLYLLEDSPPPEGRECFATVVLETEVSAAAYDRFLLRRLSPAITIAGGVVLEVAETPHRRRRKDQLSRLQVQDAFLGEPEPLSREWQAKRIDHLLLHDRAEGAGAAEVSVATLLPPDTVRAHLKQMAEANAVLALDDDFFIHGAGYLACYEAVRARIRKAEDSHETLSLGREELRSEANYPAPLWHRIMADLESAEVIRALGPKVVLPAAAEGIDRAEAPLIARLIAVYAETGFKSPRPDELPAMLGEPSEKIGRLLEYLCDRGDLVSLSKNVVLGAQSLREAQARVVALLRERGTLNSADFKYVIDSSRKYALAILDWLDARHITLRIGNDRRLAPDYQKHLL